MRLIGVALLLIVLPCSASAAADAAPVRKALDRAGGLELELKFAEVIETLRPFAEEANGEVESALANAYMHQAINGRSERDIHVDDVQLAIEFAKRAIAHGSARAPNLLYMIYGNGWGVSKDSAKALAYLRQGAEAGDNGARYNYAVILYQGGLGVARDLDRACSMFLDLTRDSGVQVMAAYYMGLVEFRGQCGHAPSREHGMELIQIAADHGVRDAERDVAKNFEFGWTAPVDLAKAITWYETAAEHGEPHSQWRLGMAYLRGEGRAKNVAKAIEYFEESAASENPNGLSSLAVMYVTGEGVEQDMVKARELYERSAALGDRHAYRELALMHINGEGVPVDPVQAMVLLRKAMALGDPEDTRLQRLIESKLDSEQLKAAREQFEQWDKARTGEAGS